jgi:hypothetical protein
MIADSLRDAERVRSALVQSALSAYKDAALQGLCCDGAWEVAVATMRQVDPGSSPAEEATEPGS